MREQKHRVTWFPIAEYECLLKDRDLWVWVRRSSVISLVGQRTVAVQKSVSSASSAAA